MFPALRLWKLMMVRIVSEVVVGYGYDAKIFLLTIQKE